MPTESAEDRWYFTKDRLLETPSRRHGYDYDKELSCRQQAANFIQDMGQKLQVSQLCINTAIVYMHRFYVFHSLNQFHRNAIATAALFLAAKVEEQPRKVEHVLKVAHLCLHRDNPSTLDPKSEMYQEQSNDLVMNESILLQTLGFDVGIDHPHTHVVRCCQLVKASKDLAQTSYFMASNSLHLTTMCLQYKPTVVACFCIHLACKWSNWEIPRSNEGKDWFWYVNQSVTLELLEQLTSEFLFIFEKCPTKLKKKMMSMNQNNPPANLIPVQSGPQNETYHFAEPRKLTGAEANRPPEAFLQLKAAEKAAAAAAAANTGQSHQQQVTRHIDYKDYKEKKDRERAQREKPQPQREGFPAGNPPKEGNISGHMIGKHAEKVQPIQRPPSSSSSMHKGYPQQRPPHAGHPGALQPKDAAIHHMKEAVKRKREEEGVGPDPKKFQIKPPPQYPHVPTSKVPVEAQTVSGIRDIITQSFPHPREKPQERPPGYPNFQPQQRHGALDKYGRPQQLPPIPTGKESTKRMEEFAHKKPEEEAHAQNRAMMQKSRDPKFKGQVPVKQPGVPSHPTAHDLASQQRKAMERAAEKSRKQHEAERGMQSYMDSLLSTGDPQQKLIEQKIIGLNADLSRKDKVSPVAKNVPKVQQKSYKPPDSMPEGLFDLLEPIEDRPSEAQQKTDQKIMGYAVDSRKDRVSPTPKNVPKVKPSVKTEGTHQFDLSDVYESDHQGQLKVPDQKRMHYHSDRSRKDRTSSHPKTITKPDPFKPQDSLPDELFDLSDEIFNEPQVARQDQLYPPTKDPKLVAKVKPTYKPLAESLFDIPYAVEPVLPIGQNVKQPDAKRLPYTSESVKKDHGTKIIPKPKPAYEPTETLPESIFDIPDPYNSELPDFFETMEPSAKIPKKEHDIKPLATFSVETTLKTSKTSSIFSPDITTPPKNIFAPTEKDKKVDLHLSGPPIKKPSSSLFSPPPVAKSSHRSSSSSDRELVITPAKVKEERDSHLSSSNISDLLIPPMKEERSDNFFPSFENVILEQKPKVEPVASPVSTVNLVGMELMVDTSRPIIPEKAVVTKPPVIRAMPEVVKAPVVKEEKQVEVAQAMPKIVPPSVDDSESTRKSKKKKEKDSHRHKEKKKKDSDRKEKKKHKDKDKERKKESHRDKERSDKHESSHSQNLKITIPKDKLSLDSPSSGLKIKIARDRLKPEDIEGAKPQSSEGSLKIKIKKDTITNYKEESTESSKKKESSSSHSSSHKSSKSSEKKSSSKSSSSHSNRS